MEIPANEKSMSYDPLFRLKYSCKTSIHKSAYAANLILPAYCFLQ